GFAQSRKSRQPQKARFGGSGEPNSNLPHQAPLARVAANVAATNNHLEKSMSNEVIEMERRETAVAAPSTTPSDLLRLAVQQGADIAKLEQLMALQERWEANQARKAYVEAMAEFKKNPPEIFKDKTVSFKTDKGNTTYDHATIGNVVEK